MIKLKSIFLSFSFVLFVYPKLVAQTNELYNSSKSSQEWQIYLNNFNQERQQSIVKKIKDFDKINLIKINQLRKSYLDRQMPYLVIAKSALTGETWSFNSTKADWLDESFKRMTVGSGMKLISVAALNEEPHYFIVLDEVENLAILAQKSLLCADYIDSYLSILTLSNESLRAEILQEFNSNSPNIDRLIQTVQNQKIQDNSLCTN
jgi:hypothetical protein